ncbi:MAG: GNAT family N-acetyltransferase [Cytophagales bacterium]|nr:MAG: GNAT family N-acetyltransferase [Cytophagales bacterium]
MTLNTQIKILQTTDAEQLSALCLRIYPQFFLYLWHEQGEWYQREKYNAAQLRREIENPNSKFYFIFLEGEPVGYLKINLNAALPDYPHPNGLEVERIYLLKEVQGKGLGKALMDFAVEQAKLLRKTHLFLYVMDSSTDSIKFYQKMGFEKAGRKYLTFEQMKEEYRGMYSMVKNLE